MIEKWWVIMWIVCKAINLGVDMAKHGEPINMKHNGVARLIGVIISVILAYLGGLFRCFE